MKIYVAFWGRGKCPICERKYQKDIRLLWYENSNEEIKDMIKLCSWCFVILISDILKTGVKKEDLNITWYGKKEKFYNEWTGKKNKNYI